MKRIKDHLKHGSKARSSGKRDEAKDGTGASSTKTKGNVSGKGKEKAKRFMAPRISAGFPDAFDSDDEDCFMGNLPPDQLRVMMRMHPRAPYDRFGGFGGRPYMGGYDRERMEDEKTTNQRAWRPPMMVEPDPMEDEVVDKEGMQNLGIAETDATLYLLREKVADNEVKFHSLLQMPTCAPVEFAPGNQVSSSRDSHTYNLLMADVSGSMSSFWSFLKEGWNTHVAPLLRGRTNLYCFGSEISLKRTGTQLERADFDGTGTDLTGALQKVVEEVYTSKEKYVRVFIVTDGAHGETRIQPDVVINQMKAAKGKIVDVFVLGAGNSFPVAYSINIRSRLHSGNSNLPSLFWAKSTENMDEQLQSIAQYISGGSSKTLKLSLSGSSLPGTQLRDTFHMNEWVYFPQHPETIQRFSLSSGRLTGDVTLQPRSTSLQLLLDVFRQWNSIIIQIHNKKEVVPPDVLAFMERLFNTQMAEVQDSSPQSIRFRLMRKELKVYETDFRTLLNKIRAILTTEKFQNELELAENILSTTVGGGKYADRALRRKGHTDEDYKQDCDEFMKIYDKHGGSIRRVPVSADDCCRQTRTSTVSDLQDPDFPEMMKLDKFEFLKQFTITGIPVLAPAKDSVIMNPWSLSVKKMLNEPYSVMSQVGLEAIADEEKVGAKNKDVELKSDDSSTQCNAIVPVFPPEIAKAMGPVTRTRLYAMCATFAILKNPHIVDFNIHFAALGVTWVRMLFENPTVPRPEFIRRRIEGIEATAALYLNRTGYLQFWEVLRDDTAQALMNESTIKFEDKTLKCESLIKPMFILHMNQRTENVQGPEVVARIVKMIVAEYIGRCLSHYKAQERQKPTPFTDFFAETLVDQDSKKAWVRKYVADSKVEMAGTEGLLLEDYYTLDRVQKAAKGIARELIKTLKEKLTAKIPLALNKKKVEKLRNVAGAGDVSLFTLRTFAREVGLAEEAVSDIFSEENLFVYTAHALLYRSSRERLTTPAADYTSIQTVVTKQIEMENSSIVSRELYDELISQLLSAWKQAYHDAHKTAVLPMTRQHILTRATQHGVQVTEATFDRVYPKYRPDVGLLSNACQCPDCPYYLKPDVSYNQHSSVERLSSSASFPHGLHRVAYELRNSDLTTAVKALESGRYSRSHTPVPPEAVEGAKDYIETLQKIYREVDSDS